MNRKPYKQLIESALKAGFHWNYYPHGDNFLSISGTAWLDKNNKQDQKKIAKLQKVIEKAIELGCGTDEFYDVFQIYLPSEFFEKPCKYALVA